MTPELPRKIIRLKNYDYTLNGFYFITICTQNRLRLFGNISDNLMRLNPAGEMIMDTWQKINTWCHDICFNELIIMPNHIHGIIEITSHPFTQILKGRGQRPAPTYSLPNAMERFKRFTTRQYINGVNQTSLGTIPSKIMATLLLG